MTYGLQISASGLMTSLYKQDVLANNLANANTAGFKADLPSTRPRLAVRQEDGLGNAPSNALLERLGGGALLNPNRISFAQGPLRTTGNSLDVAIQGDGFLTVRDDADKANPVKLTRDGRLTRNAQGELVLASSGLRVLDTSGNPIVLPDGPEAKISGDGTIRQRGQEIAQFQLVSGGDPSRLRKGGHSLFIAPSDVISKPTPATGTISQNTYEDSGVDEVKTLVQLTGVARAIDGQVSLIQTHDRLMDRAINVFGKVT